MSRRFDPPGSGPSQRQLRVGELIRRRLAEILGQYEHHDPDLERMSITVGEVRASPDLKVATAFVLPLGGEDAAGAIAALARCAPELRRLVAKGTALKFAPELRFRVDETFDALDRTRAMFADETVARDVAADDGAGDDGASGDGPDGG